MRLETRCAAMKQIALIFLAIAAAGVLTIYFFSDLVLVEPVAHFTHLGSPSNFPGDPLIAAGVAPNELAQVVEDGASSRAGGPPVNASADGFLAHRGIKGSAGGMISSFRSYWQRVYRVWPAGTKRLGLASKSIRRASIVLQERIGPLLTLICLIGGIGAISLVVNVTEKKARA